MDIVRLTINSLPYVGLLGFISDEQCSLCRRGRDKMLGVISVMDRIKPEVVTAFPHPDLLKQAQYHLHGS